MSQHIFVTGGNSGIGLALCKRLYAKHHNVYLGSRSVERGRAAVDDTETSFNESTGSVTLIEIDVADDASVSAAVATLKSCLDGKPLDALVNNAGTLANDGVTTAMMMEVNLYGVKRVTDACLPLLDTATGRICNTGSGAGPMWLEKQSNAMQKRVFEANQYDQLVAIANAEVAKEGSSATGFVCYGCSKALMAAYTSMVANQYQHLKCNVVSPGLVDTKLTSQFQMPNKLTPEDGTHSLWHVLFEDLQGNGWYYGSDCKRSPWHTYRSPGSPAYDGELPKFN